MSAGLVLAHCQQTFIDIVNISIQIRSSAALAYGTSNQTSDQHFALQVQDFFDQLDAVRTFSHTILDAITLNRSTIDGRVIDWLWSGEPRLCLEKLKESYGILQEDSNVRSRAHTRPHWSSKDRLTACMTLFNKYKNHFHFLLARDVWNQEGLRNHTLETRPDPQDAGATERSAVATDTEEGYYTARQDEPEDEPADDHLLDPKQARKKNTSQKILEEVIRWLDALDCVQKHHDTLQLRQEGTCTWFSKTDAYEKWRPGGYQSLWLNGKAGCGKSVFVASTIKYLKSTLHDREVLIFFYCDFRDQRSMDPTELMRSLLSQLFCHMLDLGVDSGDLPTKILQRKGEGTLLLSDLNKLCELVWLAARRFDHLPIVVIDAIDECADVDALSRNLVELHDDVRLLVTSRPDSIIQRHFSRFLSLSVENLGKELAEDIALHIKRELDSRAQLRLADRKMKLAISETLGRKADGRFRWVQCQLDALDWCATESDRKNMLNNLPEGLEETYEKILEGIDERKVEGDLARRTLGWLVVALAPLRLAQIIDGLSVDLVEPQSHSEIRLLVDKLSSLVSYSENTDVLTLSHFSVKEYLTCRTTLPTYRITPRFAHAEVAIMCMRHLSFLLKQPPSRLKFSPTQTFPVLSYLLSFCFNHLIHIDAQSKTVLEALKSLGSDARHLPSHWECLCELREDELGCPYPSWPSFRHDFELYILVAYSSATLLKSYLSGHPLNLRFGTNALVYAADLRKTEHALVLLLHDADVNMSSLTIDDSYRASPLEVAMDRGDDVLVGELLRRGCLVSDRILATAVCLPWHNTRVLVKLTETDAFAKWVDEIGDEKLFRGIFSSARPDSGDSRRTDEDHVALARRLHGLGQNLSIDSPFGAELVERAVHAAHTLMLDFLLPSNRPAPSRFLLLAATGDTSETVPTISFLLRRKADVHAVMPETGESALHLAVRCPWEPRRLELVKMLIDAGCDPRLCDSRNETAFVRAVKLGCISVAEALLPHIGPLPPDILHSALQCQRSKVQMIQWLLLKGADHSTTFHLLYSTIMTNASFDDEDEEDEEEDDDDETNEDDEDGEDDEDVIYRMEAKCLDLVKIFIEAGCDPAACNSEGKTPLEAAIEQQNTTIVEYLLSCNVPIPPDILSRVMSYQPQDTRVVRSLLRNGANVHVTTDSGNTLLHLAIAHRDEGECLLFVEMFVEAGCNLTARNSEDKTALEAAIEQGYILVIKYLTSCNVPIPLDTLSRTMSCPLLDMQVVQSLFHGGADVHAIMDNGDTLLHLTIACQRQPSCLKLVKVLIEAGCNPAACNFKGETALEAAIKQQYASVAEYLLLFNIPIPPGILSRAMSGRLWDAQVVQSLIHKATNVRVTMDNGDTLLHLIIADQNQLCHLEFVKVFIKADCDPAGSDSRGKAALEVAVEQQNTSIVEYLLSCNIPIPLDILSRAMSHRLQNTQMVQSLLHKGANVHVTTDNGDTLLHLAIAHQNEPCSLNFVKVFIEAGCNSAACNSGGKSVWEAAIDKKYGSVVDHLFLCNAPFPPNILLGIMSHILSEATSYKFQGTHVVQSLLRKGASVHVTMDDGDTLLHLAIAHQDESCSLKFVKVFIEAGCNSAACNSGGKSAWEVAIDKKYDSVVGHLVSHNAPFPPDILLRIMSHPRPSIQVVKLLLHNGADVHVTTNCGENLLHLAIIRWQGRLLGLELVKIFVEAGCNPTGCNLAQKSVLEAALDEGYIDVMGHLRSCNYQKSPFTIRLWKRLMRRLKRR